MSKTHFKKLTNTNYLGSYIFDDPKQTLTATVSKVGKEKVVGEGGQAEDCVVMRFTDNNLKPFILNATNLKKMQKLTGSPYIEDWYGKTIVIGTEKVKAFGDVVDALRIKSLGTATTSAPAKATESAPKILCTCCGNEITPMSGMTADALAKYTESKYGQALCGDCAKKTADKDKK